MNHFDYSNIISLVKENKSINLIGPPGSGKTTLCKKISQDLNIKLIELDELLFDENCNVINNRKEVFFRELELNPRCIIDGTYYSLMSKERIDITDKFVMLKVSFFKSLYNILKRSIFKKKFKCGERFNLGLIKFLFTYFIYERNHIKKYYLMKS